MFFSLSPERFLLGGEVAAGRARSAGEERGYTVAMLNPIPVFTLYQRDDCKLCDEAIALLAAVRAPDFESVWIDDNTELETRYGERVPVLRNEDSGHELGWPFDATALRAFLTA